MMKSKMNERGSIMVEVLAVLALLGTMGTVLYRQILQRNEELDNVNLASEMRVMKEAFAAYIQADKSRLAIQCGDLSNGDVALCEVISNACDEDNPLGGMMPDGYTTTACSYNFYVYGYILNPDLAPRPVLYGMIFPKNVNDTDSPLPGNMNLKRAARVANLIGADGGVTYPDGAGCMVHGTQAGWGLECPEGMGATPPVYAAITGTDIFIPEIDQPEAPTATVAVPRSGVAFERLHSQQYFSVGSNNANCFNLCDLDGNGTYGYCNSLNNDNWAGDTTIHVGETSDQVKAGHGSGDCDPLFWVGTTGDSSVDKSIAGQVYVKNSLYVGRDNANDRQAIAIEQGSSENKIRVYNTTGDERLTLDSHGQIIARDSNKNEVIRIDGAEGKITLNSKEVEITLPGKSTGTVSVPTLTISSQGMIESNETASFYDEDGALQTATYKLDPANISLMNDIRLAALGGSRLSEILPNYIMRDIHVLKFENDTAQSVTKPGGTDDKKCPSGYAQAIIVTPTSWSQYVTDIDLKLEHNEKTTDSVVGTASHSHKVTVDAHELTGTPTIANGETTVKSSDGKSSIILKHRGQVVLTVSSKDENTWNVVAQYTDGAAGANDPITVMAQTYCVFDKDNIEGEPNVFEDISGSVTYDNNSRFKDGVIQDDKTDREGDTTGSEKCEQHSDCRNTHQCSGGTCVSLGACTDADATDKGNNLFCVGGKLLHIECFINDDCTNGMVCSDNQCKTK